MAEETPKTRITETSKIMDTKMKTFLRYSCLKEAMEAKAWSLISCRNASFQNRNFAKSAVIRTQMIGA